MTPEEFSEKILVDAGDFRAVCFDANRGSIVEVSAWEIDKEKFDIYTTEDGLLSNTVMSICQDRAGNFWFGTDDGVTRYDDTNFQNYTERDGLSGDFVSAIYEDSRGRLWAINLRTIIQFDGVGFQTIKSEWPHSRLYSIYEDRSGNLWFNGGGVTKYDGTCFQAFSTKDGLISNGVLSMTEDDEGNMWFGTNSGITKHVPDKTPPRIAITKVIATKSIRLTNPSNSLPASIAPPSLIKALTSARVRGRCGIYVNSKA